MQKEHQLKSYYNASLYPALQPCGMTSEAEQNSPAPRHSGPADGEMSGIWARQHSMIGKAIGFTLIELLVVVLIIGILAAVALAQYQKVVEKSKATQALTLLKSVGQAAEAYYLANGTEFSSFDELSLDIPWTGNTQVRSQAQESKSNAEWSLEIEPVSSLNVVNIPITRLTGKYQGAGFFIGIQTTSGHSSTLQIYCFERKTTGAISFDSSLPAGAYCTDLMKGTLSQETSATRIYKLP